MRKEPTRRVAYLECTGDLWTDVATRLEREDGWSPVYWSGAASFERTVVEKFSDVVFQENTAAVKGQLPNWLNEGQILAIGQDLLDDLAKTEPHAVRMMDRMDPDGSYDYLARTRLFRRHVAIGLTILDRLQPDLAVFSSAPHLVYDYTFYNLCKLRGIDTVVFVETAVDGLVFTTSSFEKASEEVGRAYDVLQRQGGQPRLSASAVAHAKKLKADYAEAVPHYITELYSYQPAGPAASKSRVEIDRTIRELAEWIVARRSGRMVPSRTVPKRTAQGGVWSTYQRLAGKVRRLTRQFSGDAKPLPEEPMGQRAVGAMQFLADLLAASGRGDAEALADALDCTHHLYLAIETEYPILFRSTDTLSATYLRSRGNDPWEADVGYVEYWLYRLLAQRKKQALSESYSKVSSPVDLAQPFIYVPLQYQPEVSTQPLAGFYADQELTVEQLSKTVPAGWLVYIKEHPFQFDKKGSGELCRTIDFYERLVRFPNVRVAPLQTPPFTLIDRAKAIATATGTSGWEAISRGTPVLLFGHSWYLACEGAFDARSVDSCERAIAAIAAGYRIDEVKVQRFLQALENVGFRGYTIPDLAIDSGTQAIQNTEGFLAAVRRHGRTVGFENDMNIQSAAGQAAP